MHRREAGAAVSLQVDAGYWSSGGAGAPTRAGSDQGGGVGSDGSAPGQEFEDVRDGGSGFPSGDGRAGSADDGGNGSLGESVGVSGCADPDEDPSPLGVGVHGRAPKSGRVVREKAAAAAVGVWAGISAAGGAETGAAAA